MNVVGKIDCRSGGYIYSISYPYSHNNTIMGLQADTYICLLVISIKNKTLVGGYSLSECNVGRSLKSRHTRLPRLSLMSRSNSNERAPKTCSSQSFISRNARMRKIAEAKTRAIEKD
jgi:hypothetical protein